MKITAFPLFATLAGLLRSRTLLHLEILALRQQLAIVKRTGPKRVRFRRRDRIFWVWLYRLWPGCLETLEIFRRDTLVRWHRKGFRLYWRAISKRGPGRPPIPVELQALIRRFASENGLIQRESAILAASTRTGASPWN